MLKYTGVTRDPYATYDRSDGVLLNVRHPLLGSMGGFPQFRFTLRGCYFRSVVRPVFPFNSFPVLVVLDWSDSMFHRFDSKFKSDWSDLKSDWSDLSYFSLFPSFTLFKWSNSNNAAPLRRLDKTVVVDKHCSLIQGWPSNETLPRRDRWRCIGVPFAASSYSRFGYAWTIPIIFVSSPRRLTTEDGRAAEKAPSKKRNQDVSVSDKIL